MKLSSTIGFLFGAFFWSVEAQVLQPGNTCRILTYIPFSDHRARPPKDPLGPNIDYYGYGTWPDNVTMAKASFSLMAAAELARNHFNERDTSVVPELGELDYCNITMPDPEDHEVLYIDSGYDRIYAVRQTHDYRYILKQRRGGCQNNGAGEVENLVNGRPGQNTSGLPDRDKDFCAIIGPVQPNEVAGIFYFSESGRIPQVAYETISSKFSSQQEYPNLMRVIPDVNDFGAVVTKSLQDIWKREAIGILYDNEDFGIELERPLQALRETLDYKTVRAPIFQFQDDSIIKALQEVKAKGFRTIILLTDRAAVIDKVARIADSAGMLGAGYFWLLMGAALPPTLLRTLKHEVDSPTNKLLRGAALFTNYDRPVYLQEQDPFLAAWKSQNVAAIEKLNRLQPLTRDDEPFYTPQASYFQDEVPTEYAAYIYDAVILAGISACRAFSLKNETGLISQGASFNPKKPPENNHVKEALKTEFRGASGQVKFKPNEYIEKIDNTANSMDFPSPRFERRNGRALQDVIFGIYNIRPGEVDDNNMQR
jgi:Receptor family ligand binding region